MHSVLAKLATGVDGSGRVAFCLASLASTAIDRPRGLSSSDPHQDNFASACAAVGIQGLVDAAIVVTRPLGDAASVKSFFSAGCGKIYA